MNFPIMINTREELQEIGRIIAAELRLTFNLPSPAPPKPALPGSFAARSQAARDIAAVKCVRR
jgi:hypothetical protein